MVWGVKTLKFLLFGTGEYYERYKKWFAKEDVLALLDNSLVKQNTCFDGIKVLSPKEGIQLPYDVIVILSFYVKEMKAQLLDLGVTKEKIYHFYDLHKLLYQEGIRKSVQYFGRAKELAKADAVSGRKILLLSNDLSLGGPALALFYTAKSLVKHGWQVVLASMLDGPLREKLLSEDVPVIVDNNLQIETMKESGWGKSFSLLLCNTINFYVFLSNRDVSIPVIWWLHDSAFFYDGVNKDSLRGIDRTNLWIATVGSVPELAIRRFVPAIDVVRLNYGVEDNAVKRQKSIKDKTSKLHFVIIGYIEWRKGQDILIEAVKLLSEEIRKKAEFYLVGQNTSMMAQEIKSNIEDIPEIKMTGPVDRDEIIHIFDLADVLVCPSREDPMPTVAAEAMMFGVPCLVSSVTGTAEYIQDGRNGMIFSSEDVKELSLKLGWCIEHKYRLKQMGKEARTLFERYFSMNVFEKNLLHLTEKAVKP